MKFIAKVIFNFHNFVNISANYGWFRAGKTLNLHLTRCKMTSSNIEPNCPEMPSSPSKSIDTTSCKRPLELQEQDEKWVKRIQLDPVSEIDGDETYQRRKLRKYVLLLSYCGKDYLGMQRNPGFPTIEDELLVAMLKASLIKEEGVTCPQIYRFQRAARTDKGVSSARQIVSIKLPDDVDIPEVINEHLPEQIRVMKAVRVTQKFDAKLQCDSRSYSYLTPTFAFAPITEISKEDYRISPEVLQELRNVMNLYEGTHNFHNFTARVKFEAPSAKRYIMSVNCSDPFIRNGIEWTMIKIKGQSFMLHQIRKMVGLAMAICRGLVSKEIFKQVWLKDRCDIPIAPSLGLVLEEPHYDYYNKKYYNDGIHEPLSWESEEKAVQTFREKYIDSVIINSELEEKVTLKWLETLTLHTFNSRTDGPPEKNESSGIKRALIRLDYHRAELTSPDETSTDVSTCKNWDSESTAVEAEKDPLCINQEVFKDHCNNVNKNDDSGKTNDTPKKAEERSVANLS